MSAAEKKPRVSDEELVEIMLDLSRVVGLINSIVELARTLTREDVSGIVALGEKAGFLADRCAVRLGDIPTHGSFEAWAGLELADATGATEADH